MRRILLVTLAGCDDVCCRENPEESDLFETCEDGTCGAGESVETCPWDCQPDPSLRPPVLPHLAVVTTSEGLYQYTMTGPGPTWSFSDAVIDATITDEGDGFFSLTLEPKVALRTIAFPWRVEDYAVNGLLEDDRVYYGYLGGVVEPEGIREPYAWQGYEYPGVSFAPLLILADPNWALLSAAVNDPPRPMRMMHASQMTAGFYDEDFAAFEEVALETLLVEVQGSPEAGYAPWALALLRYREWLLAQAALPSPPAWMLDGEGFLAADLQNVTAFDVAYWQDRFETWGEHFGWMQFWGQMSNYAGPAEYASPPLAPGEEVGCCLLQPEMHARYLPDLPEWAGEVTAAGGRIGYYTRPPGDVDDPVNLDFLTDWIEKNQLEYNANTTYIDVIGRGPMGEPAEVAALFTDGTLPSDLLIEGFVDIYPAPSLMSGFIEGGSWEGGPGVDPKTCDSCTFLSLARLMQGDRIGYLGESNGEHVHHGPSSPDPYYGERQMFLYGLKAESYAPSSIHTDIKAERDRTSFWARRPRFLDEMGLTDVPDGISVKRFAGNDGVQLLAVDNPGELAGEHLLLKGRRVEIPSSAISIVEVYP